MVNVVVAPPIASAGPHPKGIDITQTRVALRALPWGAGHEQPQKPCKGFIAPPSIVRGTVAKGNPEAQGLPVIGRLPWQPRFRRTRSLFRSTRNWAFGRAWPNIVAQQPLRASDV